jgi:hypothetical protein
MSTRKGSNSCGGVTAHEPPFLVTRPAPDPLEEVVQVVVLEGVGLALPLNGTA